MHLRCVGGKLYLVTSRAGPMRKGTWSGLSVVLVYSIFGYIDSSFVKENRQDISFKMLTIDLMTTSLFPCMILYLAQVPYS